MNIGHKPTMRLCPVLSETVAEKIKMFCLSIKFSETITLA